jgi:nucleoid-associated protein YgaU
MQKDFKIGLGVGLVLATSAVLWLSTLPKLSTEARVPQSAAFSHSSSVSRGSETEDPPSLKLKLRRAGEEQTTGHEVPTTLKNEPAPTRFHIVQKGDTLSGISAKYYGSPNQWPKIVAANRSTISDPDKLAPGTRLVIPE